MRYFNIDLHISVIADIKNIFTELGHTVDDLTLSGHAHIMGRENDKVEVLTKENVSNLNHKVCQNFYNAYKDKLCKYDGFIVTHTPTFALLFEKFNKPIFTVCSTRHDVLYRDNKNNDLKLWANKGLIRLAKSGQLIPISNNLVDNKWFSELLGINSTYIPSLCRYTNAPWSGMYDKTLYNKCRSNINLPYLFCKSKLKRPYKWTEIAKFNCFVNMPYNISTMSLFESYWNGIPQIYPSIDFIMGNKRLLKQLDRPKIRHEIKMADFYIMPHIITFDSIDEISDIVGNICSKEISEQMHIENTKREKYVLNQWNNIL